MDSFQQHLNCLSLIKLYFSSQSSSDKISSLYDQLSELPDPCELIKEINNQKFQYPLQKLIKKQDFSQQYHHKIHQQTSGQYFQQIQNSRYYSKNACKNIVKKCLRSIEQKKYEDHLIRICLQLEISYEDFYSEIIKNLYKISGPSALRRLIRQPRIGPAFRSYLVWYLKERYLRQALLEGQMRDISVYVSYKNKELRRILKE